MCLGACQDQEPCSEDKLYLCWQEGVSASSISWLSIPQICSRSWQPIPCSAASSPWLPHSLVLTCVLGVGGPGPHMRTSHSKLWKTKLLYDTMPLGCPCLFSPNSTQKRETQSENSESPEVAVLLPSGIVCLFYRLLLQLGRYPVLNDSCWLSCLEGRTGQQRIHSDPLSGASSSLHFIAEVGTEPWYCQKPVLLLQKAPFYSSFNDTNISISLAAQFTGLWFFFPPFLSHLGSCSYPSLAPKAPTHFSCSSAQLCTSWGFQACMKRGAK